MNLSNIIVQGGLAQRAAEDYREQRSAREFAQGARNMLLEKAQGNLEDWRRERANIDAYRRTAADIVAQGINPPSGAAPVTATSSATGEGAGGEDRSQWITFAWPQVGLQQSYQAIANEALRRGDVDRANKVLSMTRALQKEGWKDLVTDALTGKSDEELESLYNRVGRDRVDPGSMKMDQGTGILTATRDGKPLAVNVSSLGVLLGVLKPREPKQTVIPAGSQLAVGGKIVATNTAGLEAKSAAEEKKLDYEYRLKRELELFKARHGVEATTALQRNIGFMVNNGIASNSTEAFDMLRTAMGKPEEDAILSVAGTLMRGPGYIGRKGWEKALDDATTMVRTVKRGKSEAPATGPGAPGAAGGRSYSRGGRTFTDADIEATAQKYGVTPEEVKQRLGVR